MKKILQTHYNLNHRKHSYHETEKHDFNDFRVRLRDREELLRRNYIHGDIFSKFPATQ